MISCPHCHHPMMVHDDKAGCLFGWKRPGDGCWCMGSLEEQR